MTAHIHGKLIFSFQSLPDHLRSVTLHVKLLKAVYCQMMTDFISIKLIYYFDELDF